MPRKGGIRVGDTVDASPAGVLDMGESSDGPTWSSAPSCSISTVLRICITEWEDKLSGSKAWVPRGWVLCGCQNAICFNIVKKEVDFMFGPLAIGLLNVF